MRRRQFRMLRRRRGAPSGRAPSSATTGCGELAFCTTMSRATRRDGCKSPPSATSVRKLGWVEGGNLRIDYRTAAVEAEFVRGAAAG